MIDSLTLLEARSCRRYVLFFLQGGDFYERQVPLSRFEEGAEWEEVGANSIYTIPDRGSKARAKDKSK
jgi:hypothetical protein